MTPGQCHGAHEPDTVRPLDQCQSCQHWRSTTGERFYPLIWSRYDDKAQVLIVFCGRRLPVKAEG